jgi:hypothetical protein
MELSFTCFILYILLVTFKDGRSRNFKELKKFAEL